MTTYEYRVSYRRRRWKAGTSAQTRQFARRSDAQRYIDNVLRGDLRPELSEVVITCWRRRVAPWTPGWDDD